MPAAIASALSAGAWQGLVMKAGAVVEAMARTQQVALDKTGTLAVGRPVVTDVVGGDEAELLRLAAAVESGSSHPLGRAIVGRAEPDGLTLPPAPSPAAWGWSTAPS